MSYATPAELRSRIGSSVFDEIYGLENVPPLPASLPDVQSDLEAAAAEIDGVAALRYALPVTGSRTLALLKDWNLTLAAERASARPAGGDLPEKVKAAAAQVRSYLELLRNAAFKLPDAPEKNSGSVALVQSESGVFGRKNMAGF